MDREKWPVLGRKDWDWEKGLGAGTKTKLDFSRPAVTSINYGLMFTGRGLKIHILLVNKADPIERKCQKKTKDT